MRLPSWTSWVRVSSTRAARRIASLMLGAARVSRRRWSWASSSGVTLKFCRFRVELVLAMIHLTKCQIESIDRVYQEYKQSIPYSALRYKAHSHRTDGVAASGQRRWDKVQES